MLPCYTIWSLIALPLTSACLLDVYKFILDPLLLTPQVLPPLMLSSSLCLTWSQTCPPTTNSPQYYGWECGNGYPNFLHPYPYPHLIWIFVSDCNVVLKWIYPNSFFLIFLYLIPHPYLTISATSVFEQEWAHRKLLKIIYITND